MGNKILTIVCLLIFLSGLVLIINTNLEMEKRMEEQIEFYDSWYQQIRENIEETTNRFESYLENKKQEDGE